MQRIVYVKEYYFKLPTRIRNLVKEHLQKRGHGNTWEHMTLSQFSEIHANDWRELPGMGKGGMEAMQELLLAYGLSMKCYMEVMYPIKVFTKKLKGTKKVIKKYGPRENKNIENLELIVSIQQKRIAELEELLRSK